MAVIIYICAIITAYLIGAISPSIILYKRKTGEDIRSIGSKSAGTTNIARGLGKKYATLIFVCDFLKGIIGVFVAIIVATSIATFAYPDSLGPSAIVYVIPASVFAVILGHIFPVYYRFKGGKGVATALGACLFLQPIVGAYIIIVIAILALIIRTISVASLTAFGTAPIFALLTPYIVYTFPNFFAKIFPSSFEGIDLTTIKPSDAHVDILSFAIFLCLAILVFWTHRENIKRLIAGTESSIAKK